MTVTVLVAAPAALPCPPSLVPAPLSESGPRGASCRCTLSGTVRALLLRGSELGSGRVHYDCGIKDERKQSTSDNLHQECVVLSLSWTVVPESCVSGQETSGGGE